MWSMIALGSTFRSAEPTEPREPAGATRRPLSSTRVREVPRPRSEMVFTPGPPSTTKPPKELLICGAPAVTPVDCRTLAVLLKPASVLSSRVMICTGDTELNVSRALRGVAEDDAGIGSTGHRDLTDDPCGRDAVAAGRQLRNAERAACGRLDLA